MSPKKVRKKLAMKTKHIIALKGPINVGKSTTIRKVFALLKEAYPTAQIQIINPIGIEITVSIDVDITVIIEINGTSIGIESRGDAPPYHDRLIESIERFKKAKCSIIICATRTSGISVTTVENFQREQPEFTLVWYHNKAEPQVNLREQRDDAMAQTIFKQIQNALNTP
jgi:Cdc6-like AAA superfamily ATPase